MPKRVAILGGGIAGLTAAFYLLRAGVGVTLFEAQPNLGGLSSACDFGDFRWDRFYHCILPSDSALLALIDDLELTPLVRWQKTKVGYFTHGTLHSMSTTGDLLRFPALSAWNKIRLAIGILYTCSLRDGRKLEEKRLCAWMRRIFGDSNYRAFWEPLLKCKLGESRDRASAAFIWATIKRLYSARQRSGKDRQEHLGYLQGGYRVLCDRLCEQFAVRGGIVRTDTPVTKIERREQGLCVSTRAGVQIFDSVISTLPNRTFSQIVPALSIAYRARLATAEYLGIVCFVLVLNQRLSPYYVTNLGDDDLPFTGIIEMTNLISPDQTAGHHLVYLPKYTAPDDPLFTMAEDQLWASFVSALQRVFPQLTPSAIEQRVLVRERFVQPVPTLRYSSTMARSDTGIEGLFLANTTQILNSTLNNNAMVQIARNAAASVLSMTPSQYCSAAPSEHPDAATVNVR